MAKGSVNFIEMHVEKVVLGLAGLAVLAMAGLFLVRSPNQIEYSGQKVGPGELGDAILTQADQLKKTIQNLKPPAVNVPDYSSLLEEQHAAGIFANAKDTPAALAALPLTSDFGKPIPPLGEDQGLSGEPITLVTPLKPSTPVARTGRSEVIRKPRTIGSTLAAAPTGDEADEANKPTELAWVSVAAYFPRKTEQQEMTKANYATYLTKVYLAGLDVQREEMLASGEWSDWQEVNNSQATPKVDVPEPQINSASGDLENYAELKTAYDLVRDSQTAIIQPEFYDVRAGDFWEIPPIEGFEDQEEVQETPVVKVEQPKNPRTPPQRNVRGPSPAPTGMGSGLMGGIVSGGGGGPSPTPAHRADNSAAKEKKEAQERAHKDFVEARTAYSHKDYNAAMSAAQRVADNKDARTADKTGASRVLKLAQKGLARQRKMANSGAPGPEVGGGPMGGAIGGPVGGMIGGPIGGAIGGAIGGPIGGPGRFGAIPGPMRSTSPSGTAPLVTYPKDPDRIAVWFHDDTVEAGKTYRYRMRVKLWNRYVGKVSAVKDSEQAAHAVLLGEWSLPSDAIVVTPSTYFFAIAPTADKSGARVEVWKWHKGDWIHESFDVAIGDEIGGVKKTKTGEIDADGKEVREDVDFTTGAVVLDLRPEEPIVTRTPAGKEGQFRLNESKSLVLTYLDPADGQVKQRVQALDRYDPIYKKLKDEF